MLMIVVIKLMAPRIEEMPARCREKIVRSTEAPAWARLPARGGYTVQPVPAPASTIEDARSNRKEGEGVKSLYYLSEEMLYRGLQLLEGLVSCQTLQS